LFCIAGGETIRQRAGGSVAAKYRQHGYQDRDRKENPRGEFAQKSGEKPAAPSQKPAKHDYSMGPKPVNMMGTRAVSRCSQCGTVLQEIPPQGLCPKCGFELHSCKQCTYFDPGKRFECMQPVKERVAKKDARNDCTFYEIRVTTEKETSTPATLRPNDARQAFENLFKK
jgi:predicted RNA-binding Zn-ribbon protein involved in translation (DUF1610 family)